MPPIESAPYIVQGNFCQSCWFTQHYYTLGWCNVYVLWDAIRNLAVEAHCRPVDRAHPVLADPVCRCPGKEGSKNETKQTKTRVNGNSYRALHRQLAAHYKPCPLCLPCPLVILSCLAFPLVVRQMDGNGDGLGRFWKRRERMVKNKRIQHGRIHPSIHQSR